jgi:hypothetical protein
MARVNISKKLRFEIFKRDQFSCRYCGRTVSSEIVLEIDHVIPVHAGGTNEPLNLVTACFECNRGKGKTLLSAAPHVVVDMRVRAKLMKEQKAQIQALLKYRQEKQDLSLSFARTAIEPIIASLQNPDQDIPRQWFRSVDFFIRELSFEQVLRAAEMAADGFQFGEVKDPFLYFCGICRKSIRNNIQVGEYI